jgi:hypothetical protein
VRRNLKRRKNQTALNNAPQELQSRLWPPSGCKWNIIDLEGQGKSTALLNPRSDFLARDADHFTGDPGLGEQAPVE